MIDPEAAEKNYAERFATPAWLDEHRVVEEFGNLPKLDTKALYRAAGSLGLAQEWGNLPSSINSVFEFGSGGGEGLLALSMMLRDQPEAKIVGSDLNFDHARRVAPSIPKVRSVEPDGIAALERGYHRYDLVVANMLGPSHPRSESRASQDPTLIPRLIPLAIARLKPGGVVAINSDRWTMTHLRNWSMANLDPRIISEIHVNDLPREFSEVPTPHMFFQKPERVDTEG